MRYTACAILAAAVCGCGEESRVTQPRLESAAAALVAGYEVTRLSSLGGTQSRGMAINRPGWVALTDLNDLVDIAPDVLMSAQDINDDGRITGRVRDGVTGEIVTFVARPVPASD